MKNKNWVSLVLVGISWSHLLHAETYTYTTSVGAVFTQVKGPEKFGSGWKDPSGVIWGSYIGDYANDAIVPDQNGDVVDSPATAACAKIGGKLPTAKQYEILALYFDFANSYLTPQGRKDMYAVFPDMQNRWFWSSSVDLSYPAAAYGFSGNVAEVYSFSDGRRDSGYSVRCVAE